MTIKIAIQQRIFDEAFVALVGHIEMDADFLAFASASLAANDE